MRINKMSAANLREFFSQMEQRLRIAFITKDDPVAKIAKKVLRNRVDFDSILEDLRPFCVHNIVVLPFEIGSIDRSQITQIMVCIHEAHHSLRMRGKFWEWMISYFSDSGFRAAEEASAHEASNEFYYWYTGSVCALDLDRRGYLLNDADMETAFSAFIDHKMSLVCRNRGTCFHEAASTAIEILKDMGVRQV